MRNKFLLISIVFFLLISRAEITEADDTIRKRLVYAQVDESGSKMASLRKYCSTAANNHVGESVDKVPLDIIWHVAHELFYDENEFLNLKHEIFFSGTGRGFDLGMAYVLHNNLYYGDFISPLKNFFLDSKNPPHPDLGKYLDALNTRNSITGKRLIKVSLLGAEEIDIYKYISLAPRILMSEYMIDYYFPVNFQKNVSNLEACQILDTLLIELEVEYVIYESDPADNTEKIKTTKKDTVYLTPKRRGSNER